MYFILFSPEPITDKEILKLIKLILKRINLKYKREKTILIRIVISIYKDFHLVSIIALDLLDKIKLENNRLL